MPTPYTPVPSVPATITLVDDGDPGSAATFNAPLGQLADWSAALQDQATTTENYVNDLLDVVIYGILSVATYRTNAAGLLSFSPTGTWGHGTGAYYEALTAPAGGWAAGDIVEVEWSENGVVTHTNSSPEAIEWALWFKQDSGAWTSPDGAYTVPTGTTGFVHGTGAGGVNMPLIVRSRYVVTGTPTQIDVAPYARNQAASPNATAAFSGALAVTQRVYRARV